MSREVESEGFDKEATFDKEAAEEGLGDLVGNLWGALRRRRWWFAIPATVIALAGVNFSLSLPNIYRSVATVGIVEQRVSQRLVGDDGRASDEAVGTLTRQILSRPSLLRIVNELKLYPEMQDNPPEEIADRLQTDLNIDPLTDVNTRRINALRVSYTANDARVAQQVTSRLTALFMDENRKLRDGKIESTGDFISSEVQTAKEKLDKQDAWLQAFKTRNLGQLPEQQGGNLQVLGDLRNQVQTVGSDLERARREVRSIQTAIGDKVAALQSARSELLVKFAPRHQEVVKKDAEIARYQALQEFANSGGAQAASRQTLANVEDTAVNQLRNQLVAGLESIESLTKEETRLRGEIRDYQGRVNSAPLREQELSQALRDYELLQKNYESLKSKELQQNLTENLAERQDGEQFRLLDPATLPFRPIGPNRLKFGLGGAVAGILIGLILAIILDKRADTFVSGKAVGAVFRVPLVLSIPVIDTPGERKWARWRTVLEWVGATALTLLVVSAEVFVYVRT